MRYISSVLAVAILAVGAHDILTPEQVITAMHDRYAGNWYHTLTMEQQGIAHKPDGTIATAARHETILPPGRLRIDFGDRSAGNGFLFANGHEYIFHDGKLAKDLDRLNPLLVLGYDIYCQSPAATIASLKQLHFDLSVIHEEDWEGRPAYVIGANAGDTHTSQFWIDKERLYFLRLLAPDEKDPKLTQDIRFEDYKQVESGWLAEHVLFYSDGKLVFEEKYSPAQINLAVGEDLFDPEHFVKTAR